MGFFSSIASFASKAVSVVAKVATKAYEAAKQVVGKAVGFLATKAEKSGGNVKENRGGVKAKVNAFRVFVKSAANFAPLAMDERRNSRRRQRHRRPVCL